MRLAVIFLILGSLLAIYSMTLGKNYYLMRNASLKFYSPYAWTTIITGILAFYFLFVSILKFLLNFKIRIREKRNIESVADLSCHGI